MLFIDGYQGSLKTQLVISDMKSMYTRTSKLYHLQCICVGLTQVCVASPESLRKRLHTH